MKACLSIDHPTSVIACGVFQTALERLNLENPYAQTQLTLLPSNLHLRPQKLKSILAKEIAAAKERNEKTLCIYGNCFPDLDEICGQQGVTKVPGRLCYEILLGSEQYQNIIEEMPGTYFLEKDLILNFEEYCLVPLELYDEEIRRSFFGNYQRIVYVRQPSDLDLTAKASELAKFLGLPIKIADADYSYLEKMLFELI